MRRMRSHSGETAHMHGILPTDLINELAEVGIAAPAAGNALPTLTAAARGHDLSLRIESGAATRPAERAYRAVVWPTLCGGRESQAAQRLAARASGATGAEALARALLGAIRAVRVAQSRELARA